MDSVKPLSRELSNSFDTLWFCGGVEIRLAQNGGTETSLTDWKDLPIELHDFVNSRR